MPDRAALVMTKHHAAGNDFLVMMDLDRTRPLSEHEARAICDRRRGVGADGLVRVTTGQASPLQMELRNADGGIAEMSGNGIRCVVQAAIEAGVTRPGAVEIETKAGIRRVEFEDRGDGLGFAKVEMGKAVIGDELLVDELLAEARSSGQQFGRVTRAVEVDVGNPHLVLLCGEPPGDLLVRSLGPRLAVHGEEGANVEFVAPGAAPGSLIVRVYERGVGETLACGTGACAAAVASRRWRITASHVSVVLPGGVLDVDLDGDEIVLGGPTRKVAEIRIEGTDLEALVRESESAPDDGIWGSHIETVVFP
jgi:diaminopimelate epimerase